MVGVVRVGVVMIMRVVDMRVKESGVIKPSRRHNYIVMVGVKQEHRLGFSQFILQ